jgi:Lon protease-like protein
MEKILPLFPLGLVAYPGEALNLHIFEPRYRQLVRECTQNHTTFGIPAFLNNRLMAYGTEMEISKIQKIYEDGRMDIRTRGLRVFRVLTFDNPLNDKLYAGGLVEMIDYEMDFDPIIQAQLWDKVEQLYQLLQVSVDTQIADNQSLAFQIGHRVGLSVEQEYELLCLHKEKERQLFLLEHLEKTLPIVEEMERTKQIIKMNGHFKNFDPLNF